MKHLTQSLIGLATLAAVGLLGGCPRPATPPAQPPAEQEPQPTETAGWPRTFTDAMDVETTLPKPPQRVVSLSTGFTEAIFAMGAGDRVAGRVTFAQYPPEVLDVPSVGGMIDPSLEAIVELEPDLVLAVRGTPQDVVESVRRVGIPVIARDPATLDDVLGCFRDLGSYLGVETDADALADDLAVRAEAITERGDAIASGQGRPSVLFVVGLEPVFVAGGGHFVHDMIERAGGLNAGTLVEGTEGEQWPSLSLETIVGLDPDIVVIAMMVNDELASAESPGGIASMPGWSDLSAVKAGRVYTIDPDIVLRASPRLFDALEQMADIVEDALSGEAGDG